MKHITFVILVSVALFLGCAKEGLTDADVDEAWRDRGVTNSDLCSREEVFSRLKGADSFIEKFRLTPEEIELVGRWYSYNVSQSKKNGTGIGTSISFLPNRVFIAYNNLDNLISYKLGYWKIEKDRLMIRFAYLYTRTDRQDIGEYNRKEKIETDYYPIWKFGLFEQAAVQKEKFYFSRIPRKIKKAYMIDGQDFFRGRVIIPLPFDGSRLSLYEETKRWYAYLMNPDLDDEQYAYNLRVMFTIGDVQERPYDFEKNEFGLDFSKWE